MFFDGNNPFGPPAKVTFGQKGSRRTSSTKAQRRAASARRDAAQAAHERYYADKQSRYNTGPRAKYDLHKPRTAGQATSQYYGGNRPSAAPHRTPPGERRFGKKLPLWEPRNSLHTSPTGRVAGAFAIAGAALALGDIIDGVITRAKHPNPFRPIGGQWTLVLDCGSRPGAPLYQSLPSAVNNGPRWRSSTGAISNCLAGQTAGTEGVSGGPWTASPPLRIIDQALFLADSTITSAGIIRNRHDMTWNRPDNVTEPTHLTPLVQPHPSPFVPIDPPLNPNLLRRLPSVRVKPRRGVLELLPYPQPETLIDPVTALDPYPDSAPIGSIGTGPGAAPHGPTFNPPPFKWTSDPPSAPRKPEPKNPRPPGPRVRERKLRNFSRAVGIGLFAALDTVSELAEIVDALYDALPKSVRRRWERGRDNRKYLDTAGQYGIDGADWKLQALWHNWHLIDGEAAVHGIIQNLTVDKMIGAYQKHLPRNTINAFTRNLPTEDGHGRYHSPESIISKWAKRQLAILGVK